MTVVNPEKYLEELQASVLELGAAVQSTIHRLRAVNNDVCTLVGMMLTPAQQDEFIRRVKANAALKGFHPSTGEPVASVKAFAGSGKAQVASLSEAQGASGEDPATSVSKE